MLSNLKVASCGRVRTTMVMYSRILLHKVSVRVGVRGGTQNVLYMEAPPRGLTLYRSIYHFCQSGATLYI